MKQIFLIIFFTFSTQTFASFIKGEVSIDKKMRDSISSKGTLYIFAKKPGRRGPPAAVLKIDGPKFPVTFSISGENAMIPGTPFDGPFLITARWTSTGNAMQKSGSFEGISKDQIKVGSKAVSIVINKAR